MFLRKKNRRIADFGAIIYNKIVKQSRSIGFYKTLGVPDTLDGRFELIVLHFFMIDYVIDKNINKNKEIYEAILDIMYKDFDMSLREMGVGDLSVGKKIYQMTEAFSGRIVVYRGINLKKVNEKSKQALKRNLYGTIRDIDTNNIEIVLKYVIDSIKNIHNINLCDIKENSSIFLDLNRYIVNKKRN